MRGSGEDGRGDGARAAAPSSLLQVASAGEKLARDLVEWAPDPLVVHDGETILYLNRRALELLGIPNDTAVLGRSIWDFLPGNEHEAMRARIDRMRGAGERVAAREVPIVVPGRSEFWGEFVSSPIRVGDRTLIQTTIRDVTQRRKAERALSESEDRFRSLFDAVPVGLYRSRPDGTLLSANRALVRMLGYPDLDTLLSTPIPDLYVDPADREQWIRDVAGKGVESAREIRLRAYDGSEVRARLSTRVQYDAAGAIDCFEGALEDITESHRATARFELLFRTMAQGVVFHDETGAITVANPAAERILGLTVDQLKGRTAVSSEWRLCRPDGTEWPPEERPADVARVEGRPVRGEVMGVYNPERDELRWIELEAYPFARDEATGRYQVYSVFADVTERLEAEEELRLSERRLERALSGSNLGLWDWDIQRGDLFVDSRWLEMLGYRPDDLEMDYATWLAMVHPDDRALVQDRLDAHLQGETAFYQAEIRIRAKDGSWRWILDRGQVVERADDGTPLEASGTHTDVTDRKLAEEELRRSELRLASMIRAAPVGITLSRVSDGRFLEVNDRFLELTGYARSELLGESALDLGIWLEPEDRERAVARIRKEGRLEDFPVRLRTRDGDVRNIHLFTELVDMDGQPCALAMHQDVTESRRLEEQLRQAQKMEAVGRLAGGVAHDFNNLLTALVGHVTFLMEGLAVDDPLRTEAEGIQASAERARRLTRQLLAFSRQQMLHPRHVDLGRVVTSFEPLLRRLIGEDVIVSVLPGEEPCPVVVDPGQLEQVVLNLAVNARDAMPDGGHLAIRSECRQLTGAAAAEMRDPVEPGEYAVLTVEDTGIGMAEEIVDRIFDPFFTTKPTGEGTGLGLSTVYGIVNQSNGHIRVDSQPGVGTTFSVYLPRAEESAAPADGGPAGEAPDHAGTETVLLVEDEDAVRRLAARVLERSGYTVLAAADGAGALALLEADAAVDLLVTDMVMPGVSGRQLADRLRHEVPGLPVVYMSGYTADEAVRDGDRRAGTFLEKPFTPAQLLDAVRSTLDR